MGNCFPQLWHQWVPEEPDPSHQSIIFSGSKTMGCCPVQWMGHRARERLNYNSCWVKVTFIIVALTPDNYKSKRVVAPIIIKTGLQLLTHQPLQTNNTTTQQWLCSTTRPMHPAPMLGVLALPGWRRPPAPPSPTERSTRRPKRYGYY